MAKLERHGRAGRPEPEQAQGRDSGKAIRSAGEKLLRLFGDVHHDEMGGAALLSLAVFLELAAYYFLKVVREPLIMMAGGAEVKRYAAAGQAAVLFGAVQIYARLAARLDRMKLLETVNLFFIVTLLAFCALGFAGLPIGVPFFIWVGVFNVTMVAQFWAFANDLYAEEQGRRLFGVVGIGGAIGAVAGSHVAGWLFAPLGPYLLISCAALLLVFFLLLLTAVNRREKRSTGARAVGETGAPLRVGSAFRFLRHDRYLLLVAAVTLVFNWVNTIGEYVLDRKLLQSARVAAVGHADSRRLMTAFIGTFRAKFFGWVNLSTLLLQLFAVSRLMASAGVVASLFVTPVVALGGYSVMSIMPVLGVVAAAKAAENSLGYSLQSTARQALFLVTSRESKYKVKTTIDTFFWRAGDVLSAIVVLVGGRYGLKTKHFIWLDLGLVVLWLGVMALLGRAYRTQAATTGTELISIEPASGARG